jgi:hypothetical protein
MHMQQDANNNEKKSQYDLYSKEKSGMVLFQWTVVSIEHVGASQLWG